MKKKLILSMVCVMLGMTIVCAYQGYTSKTINLRDELLLSNIEALGSGESSGITLEYCWEKSGYFGTYRNICPKGTNMSMNTPSTPTGTIYKCSSSKSQVSLLSRVGYCYVNK